MTGRDGGWVLPDNIDAPTRCYQIEIPDDPLYIAAFMGALWELQYWENWQRDPAHKGIQVARRLRPLLENIKYCDGTPVNTGYAGAGGGDEELIRQNPDNPCEIQSSVDGTTWCTFIDLSLCVTPGGQPGDGTTQPVPGGGEACYHARMQGNGVWLLPAPVNSGDVLTISNATGAVVDGTLSAWRCPDGGYFFGGSCLGTTVVEPTDPLPAEPHLSLICKIGGTFYPALLGSPFTVPSGVVNQQVTFQVNDDPIADNHGDFTFDVCVTNNQASTWASTINFKTGLHGFTLAQGNYVAGSGIQGVYQDPASQTALEVSLVVPSTTLTSVSWTAMRPAGAGDNDRFATNHGVYGGYHTASGSPVTITEVHTEAGVTLFDMALNLGTVSSAVLFLQELHLEGIGVKPPGLP